jgi:hypothetical protein
LFNKVNVGVPDKFCRLAVIDISCEAPEGVKTPDELNFITPLVTLVNIAD